jgi:MFS family permease
VLSYAPLIFAAASVNSTTGTNASMEAYATVSIGIMKFIVTVLVIWKIESVGRRSLLLWGIATISVGLFLLAVAFAGTEVVQKQNTDTNDGTQQQNQDENEGGDASYTVVESAYSGFYLAVPGVLLVVCGYSMSYGPLTWLITSELYPTEIRGRALGVSTIVTYACAAIVTYTFLSASAWVGSSILFSCYLLITCIGFIFAYMAVPDTGGRNPEGIEQDLDHMVWWQGRQQRNAFVRSSMGSKHTTLSSSNHNVSEFVVKTEIT